MNKNGIHESRISECESHEISACLKYMIDEKKQLPMEKSIQIFRGLLLIMDEVHEDNQFFIGIAPEYIQVVETENGCMPVIMICSTRDPCMCSTRDSCMCSTQDSCLCNVRDELTLRMKAVGFQAPEAAMKDAAKIGRQTDYYAATAIFYYCLSGKTLNTIPVFQIENPDLTEILHYHNMRKESGKILWKILRRGLAPGRRFRYKSSDQIREDLNLLEASVKQSERNRHFHADILK